MAIKVREGQEGVVAWKPSQVEPSCPLHLVVWPLTGAYLRAGLREDLVGVGWEDGIESVGWWVA